MPANTLFVIQFSGDTYNAVLYTNAGNKLIGALDVSAGILSIEKASAGYTRTIITTCQSGGTGGKIFVGSINTNTKTVNCWYKFESTLC